MKTRNLIWILILAVFSLSLQARFASADCVVTGSVFGPISSQLNTEIVNSDPKNIKVGFAAIGVGASASIQITDDGSGCVRADVSGNSDGNIVVTTSNVQGVHFGDSITVGGQPFNELTAGTDIGYDVSDYAQFSATTVHAGNNIVFTVGTIGSTAGTVHLNDFQAGGNIVSSMGSSSPLLTTNNVGVSASNFQAGGVISLVVESPVGNVQFANFQANNALGAAIQFIVDNAGPAANVQATNFNGVGSISFIVNGGLTRSFSNFVSSQGSIQFINSLGGDSNIDSFSANNQIQFVLDTIGNAHVNNVHATNNFINYVIQNAGTVAVNDVDAGEFLQFIIGPTTGGVTVQNINARDINNNVPSDIQFVTLGVQGNVVLHGPIDGSFAGTAFTTPSTADTTTVNIVENGEFVYITSNNNLPLTTTVAKNGATAVLADATGDGIVDFFGGVSGIADLVVAPMVAGITTTATSGAAGQDVATKIKSRSATFSKGAATITGLSPFDVQIKGTGNVRLDAHGGLQNIVLGQRTTAAFASVAVDSTSDVTGLVNGLVFAPTGNNVALNSPTGVASCPPETVTAATTDEMNKVFATNTQSGRTTCLAQRFVTGSLLEIFEPTGITASATELPFIFSTADNYWDVSTSITPPDGCTVDKTTQSTTVDHSTDALVFTLNCGSSGATGAAVTGAAVGGNGGASGKHVVKDCTGGKGCRVTNLNINIPDAAQARAAAPAKEKAPPINGAVVNGGSDVDPLLLIGMLAVIAVVAVVAFSRRKKQ